MDEDNLSNLEESELLSEEEVEPEVEAPVVENPKRGRPKAPPKPPKENGKKVRSAKQIEAFEKARVTRNENKAILKAHKEEKMAEIYMKSKEKREAPVKEKQEIIVDSDVESVSSESEPEITPKQYAKIKAMLKEKRKIKEKTKREQPSGKVKRKPKIVYESSDSESSSSSVSSVDSSSDEEPVTRSRSSKSKVSVRRPPQEEVKTDMFFG